ncbi:MAG: thioredoxin family protein [Thermoprotei archaeon]
MEHEHHHVHEHELFDEETKNALRKIFTGFKRSLVDVLVLSPTDCPTCGEAEHLARELMKISNGALEFKIIDRDSDIAKKLAVRYVPAFIYDTRKRNIRYYGLPSGQEFAPFIYIHQYIANNQVNLPKEAVEIVESIENPIHVKIFVTPECPYCPLIVDAANQMGLVNSDILVETIEAIELPLEADIYRVMYVPFVVITDPARQLEYGAKPVEVINGYVPPEDMARIFYEASRKLRKR